MLLLAQEGGTISVALAGRGWYLGERQVERGERLSAIAELVGREAGELALDCAGAGPITYSCRQPPCRVPVCSTKVDGVEVRALTPPGGRSFSGMLAALLKREPRQPEVMGVRGTVNVNDAVLPQAEGAVHFGAALQRAPEGRYCLRLTRLPEGGAARVYVVDWNRTANPEGRAKSPDLVTGTYTLETGPAGGACEFEEADRARAWVLIVKGAAFTRANQQWKADAAGLREMEQAGTSPAVAAMMRHLILASLADAAETP